MERFSSREKDSITLAQWRASRVMSCSYPSRRWKARSSAPPASPKGGRGRDDDVNVEPADGLEGRARLGERGLAAEELRKDHAEAVFPQRVAGNQHARLRRMEHHRVRVVPRRRDHLPVEPAHLQDVAVAEGIVVAECLCALVGDREDQRLLVQLSIAGASPCGMPIVQPNFFWMAAFPPMWSEWQWVLTRRASFFPASARSRSASVCGAFAT